MYNLQTIDQLLCEAHEKGDKAIYQKLLTLRAEMELSNIIAHAPRHVMSAWRERCQEPEISLGDLTI